MIPKLSKSRADRSKILPDSAKPWDQLILSDMASCVFGAALKLKDDGAFHMANKWAADDRVSLPSAFTKDGPRTPMARPTLYLTIALMGHTHRVIRQRCLITRFSCDFALDQRAHRYINAVVAVPTGMAIPSGSCREGRDRPARRDNPLSMESRRLLMKARRKS